jgi:hypothetical protein
VQTYSLRAYVAYKLSVLRVASCSRLGSSAVVELEFNNLILCKLFTVGRSISQVTHFDNIFLKPGPRVYARNLDMCTFASKSIVERKRSFVYVTYLQCTCILYIVLCTMYNPPHEAGSSSLYPQIPSASKTFLWRK